MKREDINEILFKWGKGQLTTEEANKQLAGTGLAINPNKTGNAMVDSGIGSMDPVNVVDGKIVGGSAPQCDIYYNGKIWHNVGDDPTLIPGGYPRTEAKDVQRTLDMSRQTKFANTTQIQHVNGVTYEVEYDADGYAHRATKKK